jgi:glycosyltransferase involved in cell wall biosynthesis
MVVVYYTQTYYLDATLETIQAIKNEVELHMLIELAPESQKTNIIDVNELEGFNNIEECNNVLGEERYNQLKKYLEGVASVKFIVHKNKKSFSFESLKVTREAGRHIKKIEPDIVHLDTISSRSVALIPYLRNTKVFVTVHDPVAHSGEQSWKDKPLQLVFSSVINGLFFYSKFASDQFQKYYPKIAAPKYLISFQPFSFIKHYAIKEKKEEGTTILFFGRISTYKGVDLLLEALPIVIEKYPDAKFVIAGKVYNYEIKEELVNKYKNNLQLITDYISVEDLAQLIDSAKFIVCPYRDATQSGVLMTSFAFGKMVIASNVGAFPEYIIDNVNGMLAEPNTNSIANKIIAALYHEKYKELGKNVTAHFSEDIQKQNKLSLLTAYHN